VFIHEIILWIVTNTKKLENVTNTLMIILFWIKKKGEGLWIIYSMTRELMYVIQKIQKK
jgi:hypothetical protein